METVRNMTGHWPTSNVHFEAFSEAETRKPHDKPFKVRMARSGATIEVPVGTTILEAIRAAGYDAPSSCESGSCGTCRTRLVAGEVDHRDLVLAEHEKHSNIMICVSRAMTDVIEIDR
jgi:phthalate 4,5-dioxygenase reductase subunit